MPVTFSGFSVFSLEVFTFDKQWDANTRIALCSNHTSHPHTRCECWLVPFPCIVPAFSRTRPPARRSFFSSADAPAAASGEAGHVALCRSGMAKDVRWLSGRGIGAPGGPPRPSWGPRPCPAPPWRCASRSGRTGTPSCSAPCSSGPRTTSRTSGPAGRG